MPRASVLSIVLGTLLLAAGCRSPERDPIRPLSDGQLHPYGDLLGRARNQASAAVEAFYIDSWLELEDLATGLEQTARFLPKTVGIPASLKDTVGDDAAVLQKDALTLAAAARTKDVQASNAALQRINLKIRQLRPTEVMPAVK